MLDDYLEHLHKENAEVIARGEPPLFGAIAIDKWDNSYVQRWGTIEHFGNIETRLYPPPGRSSENAAYHI